MSSLFKLSTKTIVAIGIGAALYGVLGTYGFPVLPNTYVKPALVLLVAFSAIFGPLAGFLIGTIGHVLTDAIGGYGFWIGWELSSGIIGAFIGLTALRRDFNVLDGAITKASTVALVVYSTLGAIVGLSFAGAIDVVLQGEPLDKVTLQVIWAVVSDLLVFYVVGIPAIYAIARSRRKPNFTKAN